MPVKLLITGSEGLLGQNLLKFIDSSNTQVLGLDLANDPLFPTGERFQYKSIDMTDRAALLGAVTDYRPDVILNCAAMTAVDRCESEPERCFAINTHAVETLATAARELEARLIQISTDYVFDGTNGPYLEDDPTNPISVYGRSKYEAERIVLALPAGLGTVVRTVVLYGTGRNLTSSFVTWLIEMLRSRKPVRIVDDQISNVTLASDLAKGLLRIVRDRVGGILHYASQDVESRFDFAKRVARIYGLDAGLITPVATVELHQPAPRPLLGGLKVEKVEHLFSRRMLTIEETIQQYKSEVEVADR